MEKEIHERIRLILDKESITSSQFAKIVGFGASSISHVLSGRNKPGFDFLHETLKKFENISPDWLLLGKGEMYRKAGKSYEIDYENVEKEQKSAAKVRSEPQAGYFSDVEEKSDSKKIVKVIVFYSDKTFSEYKKSDK